MIRLGLVLAITAFAPLAHAQDAPKPASCAAPSDDNLPATWLAWKTPQTVLPATDAAKAPDVTPGHAYALTLSPVAQVLYPVLADKPPIANTFGGLLSLKVAEGGTYSIAVDDKAWIDVVKDGAIVKSVSHNHGPVCTTVRKAVDFKLDPGLYAIQIANAPTADLKLAIISK
ncbi:homogentisate 1,2-dioxygenase [Asticcacaulis sp. 201]|uniref:homogentisate 1,2-dioxygenase n=1 Tax=Asticcacaulis sp. 201 TaxID=3028787 RepID=UPI0029168A7C|nr:homogentisate 1,2-dioxygenase [Asticcacaulis sp. 201]MDV6332738.1 homogentisate 1,2-dioxygenase [Asticcacaulis sp. 201]